MAPINITEIIYPKNRKAIRQWLEKNHKTKADVWIAMPKKDPKFDYNDLVEEVLCFNWIDSTKKRLNEDYTIQRISPRRKGAGFSQLNIERLKLLMEQDIVHPDFKQALREIADEAFIFPKDIIRAIQKNKEAWRHYELFPEPYKRLRVFSIELAREDKALFNNRLEKLIEHSRLNKMVAGLPGMEKYFTQEE